MAKFTSGKVWADGEQVTAALLNQMIANMEFDDAALTPTLEKDTATGKLKVSDSGIDTAQLRDDAVTLDKMEHRANMTLIGNTSGSASAPSEVPLLDEDDMASDSPTALATQQSIKAYIDNLLANNTALGQSATFTLSDGVVTESTDPLTGWTETDPNNLGSEAAGIISLDVPGTYLVHFFGEFESNDTDTADYYKVQYMIDSVKAAERDVVRVFDSGRYVSFTYTKHLEVSTSNTLSIKVSEISGANSMEYRNVHIQITRLV